MTSTRNRPFSLRSKLCQSFPFLRFFVIWSPNLLINDVIRAPCLYNSCFTVIPREVGPSNSGMITETNLATSSLVKDRLTIIWSSEESHSQTCDIHQYIFPLDSTQSGKDGQAKSDLVTNPVTHFHNIWLCPSASVRVASGQWDGAVGFKVSLLNSIIMHSLLPPWHCSS